MTQNKPDKMRPKSLNLASLVPPLPPVTLPNGKEVQIAHLSAKGYEMYREMQTMILDLQAGRDINEDAYITLIDNLLAIVLPDASPDDLASIGARVELKMAPILAAAGRVDEVLEALESAAGALKGNAEALPDSQLSMISVAPSPDTAVPLVKIG